MSTMLTLCGVGLIWIVGPGILDLAAFKLAERKWDPTEPEVRQPDTEEDTRAIYGLMRYR